MSIKRNPTYYFKNRYQTGIYNVPLGSLIHIADYDGFGTTVVVEIIGKNYLYDESTIGDFLDKPELYKFVGRNQANEIAAFEENGKLGYRLSRENEANHGNIGEGAIDLSISDIASDNGATGDGSLATGLNNISSGAYSVVSGYKSQALGYYSQAEGYGTIAQNDSMHAEGKYNVGTSVSTIHEIGIGTSDTNRRNALEIYTDGRIRTPELTLTLHDNPRSLVTKEYVDLAAAGAGNLYSDGSVPMDTGYVPSADLSLATKEYVDLATAGAGNLYSDGSIPMDTGYVPAVDLDIATKEYVDLATAGAGNLKSDGSIPMDTGYVPSVDLNIATKEYVDLATAGAGNLKSDGSVLMDTGYVPSADLNIATKEYVDANSGDGNLKSDGSIPMDTGYSPAADLDLATKEYVDSNSGAGGNLKSDGSVLMDTGYSPSGNLNIATKEYVDSNSGAGGNLKSDGSVLMDTGYIPAEDLSIVTKEYVDANSGSSGTPLNISYLSKSGRNSQFITQNGKLYSTCGSNSSYYNTNTGRGLNGQVTTYGVKNFYRIGIPENSPIKKVVQSYANSACLLENGELFTWGGNPYGGCGLGHSNPVAFPTLAATGVNDIFLHPSQGEFSVDEDRLFIVKADGLYSAGYNTDGQLGVGDTSNKNTFTKCVGIPNGATIQRVFDIGATSGFTFVLADNKIYFSGTNNTGVAGVGDTSNKTSFIDVTTNWSGESTVQDIKVVGAARYRSDSGDSKPCAIMLVIKNDTTRLLKSCGNNSWGSLGIGSTTNISNPQSVQTINANDVIDIAGFGSSPLTGQALTSSGNLYAWGYNEFGQVGDGTTVQKNSPVLVQSGVKKLLSDGMCSHTYGYYIQSFIVKNDGTLWGCGINDSGGYLGIGNSTANITTFTKSLINLSPGEEVIDIGHYTTYANGRIVIALTNFKNLFAWGYNSQNGVFEGSTGHKLLPHEFKIDNER